jgi:hypothetical protein
MALKFLDVKNFQQLQDFAHQRYFVKLRPSETFDDLFVPTFWSYHKSKLTKYDTVRVVAHDDSFDVDLAVHEVVAGGVVMRLRPLFGSAVGAEGLVQAAKAAEAASLKIVPIAADGMPEARVEFLPATQWRVLGLGSVEVARDLASEPKALDVLSSYLTQARLVLPSDDEIAAAKAKAAANAAEASAKASEKTKRKSA